LVFFAPNAPIGASGEEKMQRGLIPLALGVALATAACAQQTPTPPTPAVEVTLTRLDCGTSAGPADVGRFSDVYSHQGLVLQLVFSCYLIKHGDEYMLWDTGHSLSAGAVAPKVSLVDQLARLQIKPEQIKFVGISHYHPDHTGQVGSFPQTTLLIGKGDWDVLTSPKPPANAPTAPFAHFISGGGKVEPVPLDKDVFNDRTVVMLATPGHTQGHHSLMVNLREKGTVLISGDLMHFHENYDSDGVPPFNTSRSETLASLARLKTIAANTRATVIIQHDARDVGKLPAFPATAR
jgi:N-acyl homoserine lactone hydrolase